MTSLHFTSPAPSPSLERIREASPLLWWTSLAFLAGFVICVVAGLVDTRMFNGISVWVKPAKFFLSLAVHMLTLSFGLTLLPATVRNGLAARGAVAVLVAMAVFEMAYIAIRAGRGEASHFNVETPFASIMYSLMGAGAVLIMVSTGVIGGILLRRGPSTLLARTTGSGFILAAILTIWVGLALGGNGSHWIGGDRTDATGLPVFGWSTTGGDFRVAHFVGLHLVQALPFVALSGNRRAVWAAAAAGIVITIAAYIQAVNGLPLIAL
jgi:hypothetical protein